MNFTNRITLGAMFADTFQEFRGKNAVILCLQESSLLTCITMAGRLRAYIYPLLYTPVYTEDYSRNLMGAFDQDGAFCPSYDASAEKLELSTEQAKIIEDQRPLALKAMQAKAESYGLELLDKHRMDGRDVILAGDIISSTLPLVVAQQFLKNIKPKSLSAIAGNSAPQAAQLLRMSAAQTKILDILSDTVRDDDYYFEHADAYTLEQKQTLTQHITAYWE